MPYTIEEHKHRFAAWAASLAASVPGCRFTVEQGRNILEAAGFNNLVHPDDLPLPHMVDVTHRCWREKVRYHADQLYNLDFTHGVAAKLINVYLKAVFTCGGFHDDCRVKNLHPPIDRGMLTNLADHFANHLAEPNVGGLVDALNEARDRGWANFDSEHYENVIMHIREALRVLGEYSRLWKIEEYWEGHQ